MSDPDRDEAIILSVAPAPAARPMRLLGIFQEDGWWCGWSEPVLFIALVERRWYTRDLDDLPGNPRARRRFLQDRERSLQPVAYDVNSSNGLSTLDDMRDCAPDTEWVDVIGDDATWETVALTIQSAAQHIHWRRATREKKKALGLRAAAEP